ncbi:MAG: hypothetical protein HYV53_02965, partial [Parcubacteria group bacterium]|nr:hypothetical protein [Parcubacteria group bacterium]
MKILKSLLSVGLVLLFALFFSVEARAQVAAPRITKLVGGENFAMAGTAPAGSEVLIYLDGSFVGQVETKVVLKQAEAIFNFQYQKKQKLADGAHTVMAIAKDKTSLVLSAPSVEVKFTVNLLPAPTLIAPNQKTITAKTKPLIVGLVRSGSLVKIFIDGIYDGKTEILNHDSNTANFAYQPVLNLSRGQHQVYAIAENKNAKVSQISEVLRFNIELPMPAPTMLKPVVNKNTSNRKPFIVGLAKNNSKIKVYIDKKFNGEFTVKNHPSGTANFAYRPVKPLVRGSHLVYAVAIDKRGKESFWSNIAYFSIRDSAIAQSAKEKNVAVAKIEKSKKPAKAGAPVISGSSGAIEEKPDNKLGQQQNQAGILEKIKNLVGNNATEKTATSQGLINEGR